VRKKIGDMRYTLPQGVQGPFFNDEFGDVYGVIYALQADGFSYAELKTLADDVRQQLLRVPDVAKVELFGVQDEALHRALAAPGAAGAGHEPGAGQLSQQNAVEGRRGADAAGQVQVRVGGQFTALEDARHAHPRRLGRAAAPGRHRRDHARLCRSAHVKVRFQGEVIALGVSMAKGGDIIAGQGLHAVAASPRLPVGVSW
jgi:multidrug efflux pump subunit AcrB